MIHIYLPVKNESKNIHVTLNKLHGFLMRNFNDNFSIIFIDDHSSDSTLERIREIKSSNTCSMKNTSNPGKGSALRYGFNHNKFMHEEGDIIIFLDGDGQIELSDIIVGLNLMKIYNADVVIGNKRHQFSTIKYSPLRQIVSLSYNFLVRLFFQIKFEDTQCGLKIFKEHAISSVINEIDRDGFAFDIDLIKALKKKDFRIVDCPVKVNKQMNSGSVNLKNIFNVFFDTIYVLFKS